jgi:phage baseplate assembly protein W
MATGNQCVGEAIARRWGTSPGELIDDPYYGYNLSDLIGQDLSPSDLAYAQQQAAAEAQKDERVLACTVTMTLTTAGLLTVIANVRTASGPFQLVLAVSSVSTTILLITP